MTHGFRWHLPLGVLLMAAVASGGEYVSLVDPFWGNGKTELPPSGGWARGWDWLKAQMGNTIPGALTPFGWVSVCAYSGNYPCGYGNLKCCCEGSPSEAAKELLLDGFTHFHHNGTGFARRFYNYFLFSPGAVGSDFSRFSRVRNERASPGWYAADLVDRDCSFEVVARPNAACHRYRFPSGKGRIVIDTRHIGLRQTSGVKLREKCEGNKLREVVPGRWEGVSRFHQLDFHFSISARAQGLIASVTNGVITLETEGDTAETFIGFSLVDGKAAVRRAEEAERVGFAESRREAEALWENALSRVRVRFDDERLRRLFYSTLYFSCVKPMETEKGFLDFFTLWDVYRTQLPLVLSLFPNMSRRMVDDMMTVADKHGFFPIHRNMTGHWLGRENGQATALGTYVFADAFFRNVLTDADYPRLKTIFVRQLEGTSFTGKSHTYFLDYAGAARAAQFVAERCGDAVYAEKLRSETDIWRRAYDPDTGYLVNTGKVFYYEGTYRNYSFRAHPGMANRIALAGGRARFEEMLDGFFSVGREPSDWSPNRDRRHRPDRFEGLTNQTDMDAPYTYLWCGRADRLADVLNLVRHHRFGEGPGGCPGNNDSGATSSWYVWSCLGLYPLTGTPYYLIGSPSVCAAELDFARGTLKISVERESATSTYPCGYSFNGRPFRSPWIPVSELERGGKLVIRLNDHPSAEPSPVPDWLD